MEWQEVSCLVEALRSLVAKYESEALKTSLDEDERSDISNDLAYAEILLHKYEDIRAKVGRQ